jgi:hypothetical protein
MIDADHCSCAGRLSTVASASSERPLREELLASSSLGAESAHGVIPVKICSSAARGFNLGHEGRSPPTRERA